MTALANTTIGLHVQTYGAIADSLEPPPDECESSCTVVVGAQSAIISQSQPAAHRTSSHHELTVVPDVRRTVTGTLDSGPTVAAVLNGGVMAARVSTATNDDVVRMLMRYRGREFSLRSMAGKIAVVHESRVERRKRRRSEPIDIENMSHAEVMDAVNTACIRRAVYAKPEVPVQYGRAVNGVSPQLHRVIAAEYVASIVRPRSKHGASAVNTSVRDWRADVGKRLGELPNDQEVAVLDATDIRIKLQEIENELSRTRSEAERLKSGGRIERNRRRHATGRVAELDSLRRLEKDRLSDLTRTKEYRRGMRELLRLCTQTEELELYFFGS